jgi:hypothetical protein
MRAFHRIGNASIDEFGAGRGTCGPFWLGLSKRLNPEQVLLLSFSELAR